MCVYVYTYIYIYIYIYLSPGFGRGDDTDGNPHRAQISQFELFELILLLKVDKQFPVEQFEPTVFQSTVSSPPLNNHRPPKGGIRKEGSGKNVTFTFK